MDFNFLIVIQHCAVLLSPGQLTDGRDYFAQSRDWRIVAMTDELKFWGQYKFSFYVKLAVIKRGKVRKFIALIQLC